MSDDKRLPQAAETMLQRYVDSYEPTRAQTMAKSRLMAHMELHPPEVGTIDTAYLVKYTGSAHVQEWMDSDPNFIYWLLDKDYIDHEKNAYRQLALTILRDVAMGNIEELKTNSKGIEYVSRTPVKDRVKASEILLNYADAMPAKRKDIRWMDEDIGKLSGDSLEQARKKARAAIAGDTSAGTQDSSVVKKNIDGKE